MSDAEPSAPAPNPPEENSAASAAIDEGKTPPPAPEVEPAEATPPAKESAEGDAKEEPTPPDKGSEAEKPAAEAEGTEGEAEPPAPESSAEEAPPDLKSMTRAERGQYFQNLDAQARREAEAIVNEVYQPQPVEELVQKYVDQGHSEFEAKMLAREEIRDQDADISKARAERAELNASLATDAMEILNTVDWLNPANKTAYDKESSDAATELYDQLCLTRDENTAERDANGEPIPGSGQIIGATMSPKQFYGLIDKIRSSGLEGAQLSAQKAAEEQMAAVAAPSSNSNNKEPSFDSLSNEEKRAKLRAEGRLIT